ncbi:hypothetical protein BAY61_27605 [Prauserella marina]|uniref:ABC-2 family transporter protein n=1 Tax=Prauserella marina TaxID=530584 RepID=A0A222VW84_9PSEU|nr:ABC transporter permease [Prauserella marina]ASR38150.1 hypothetical protein BAY61_27605 [Prauserella marina]PWV78682.1 ABC-2 family transporter [Prauserella marina]SDC91426.1 ABC-2 family transporter protein [Prauserella marina]
MTVVVSEWLKVRTVRSTYWLLAATAAVFAIGCVVSVLMVADWDSAPPGEQASFGSADMSVMVLPFMMFSLGALGAMAITAEYGSGMIRSALVSVPKRLRLLTAKAVVVGVLALAVGFVLSSAMLVAVDLIVGDRPAPIAAWPSISDGVPYVLASSVTVMVVALVGLGLGTAIRSAAGSLVTMTVLLYVLPVVVFFLPAPWSTSVSSVLLLNLPHQLAGDLPGMPLSQAGAAVALASYVVLALGAAALSISKRDA